jgi:hypothetical protein
VENRDVAQRYSLLGIRHAAGRVLGRVHRRDAPFDRWSYAADLIEAFVDAFAERHQGTPCDEGLASMVSGLLGGTGCAIFRTFQDDAPPISVAVTGTWEGASLPVALDFAGADWVSALGDAPMVVVRRRGAVRLRVVRRLAQSRTAGVALPLRFGGDPVGALLVTYSVPRAFGAGFLAAAKLLAGCVAMQLAGERFEVRSKRQGERISRLTSDVERLGVLLRRVDAERLGIERS